MAPEKPLDFTTYARSRMHARGLTETHVSFCRSHNNDKYEVRGVTAWVCKLPDGRNMKVKTKDTSAKIIVIDVFTFS